MVVVVFPEHELLGFVVAASKEIDNCMREKEFFGDKRGQKTNGRKELSLIKVLLEFTLCYTAKAIMENPNTLVS